MLPSPVRCVGGARFDTGAGEQPLFENLVAPLRRQWPADPRCTRSLKIVLDRAARHPERTPDLPRAYAVVVQTQHLPQLPHRQLSSGRHQCPSSLVEEGLMPESLTRKKRRQPPQKVAGFKSEWRPDLFRNAGRLQIGIPTGFHVGTPGRIKSESAAGEAEDIISIVVLGPFH